MDLVGPDTRFVTSRRTVASLAAALLVWSFVGNLGLGEAAYVLRNVLLTVAVLLVAAQQRCTATELGLDRTTWRRGLIWGGVAVAVVAVAVTVGALAQDRLPIVGALLADDRADLAGAELAWNAAVRIPVGTALFEEVAFRGVLLALWWRIARPRVAVVGSSVVFGLWHVAPTIVALRVNDVVPMSGEGIGAVAGAVVLTTVAGVGFCLLRRGSGSLVAPILAHWATNAIALVAAAWTHG